MPMDKAPGMPAKFESKEGAAPNRSTKIKELWRKLFGTDMPEGGQEEEPSRRMLDKEPREREAAPAPKKKSGDRYRRLPDGTMWKDPMPYDPN